MPACAAAKSVPIAALRAPNQSQSPDKAGLWPALSVPVPRLRRGLDPSPSPGLGSNKSKSVQNWPNQSPVPPFGRQISPKVPIMPACGAAKSVSSAALRAPNQSQSPDKAGLRPALSVPVPRLRRGLDPSPSPGLAWCVAWLIHS